MDGGGGLWLLVGARSRTRRVDGCLTPARLGHAPAGLRVTDAGSLRPTLPSPPHHPIAPSLAPGGARLPVLFLLTTTMPDAYILHRVLRGIATWAVVAFFTEIHIIGSENVPKDSPIIV